MLSKRVLSRWTPIVFALLFLIACSVESGPDTDSPTEQPDIAGNNAATLSGAALGSDEADVQALRKEVDVTLMSPSADFELGTFYASRPRLETDSVFWILPLTNVGDETRCFVKVVDITFRDSDGGVLSAEDSQFVDGSVGALPSSIYTSTCLAPAETGYILGIQLDDNAPIYSDLDAVEIGGIEVSSSPPAAPDIRVIPQRYAVSMNQELSVNVENEGSQIGYVTDATTILLDADDLPLNWTFLDLSQGWDGDIAPAETRTLVDDIRYQGQAEKIRVITDFDSEPPEEVDAQGLTGVESHVERLQRRNAREQAKLEALQVKP